MTFTSRLKLDAKCVYQQWNCITVANSIGTPPADWVHGYLYFEPGAGTWKKGFRRYLHIVKNWFGNFSLNSSRVRALGWPLLGFFFGDFCDFLLFWGGSVGQIIYREYIVFRGSNISRSLAKTNPAPSNFIIIIVIFGKALFWPLLWPLWGRGRGCSEKVSSLYRGTASALVRTLTPEKWMLHVTLTLTAVSLE